MKKILPILAASLVLAGCSNMTVTQTKPDGSQIRFHAFTAFSNSTLKGLQVDGTTKTTSKLLGVTSGATEPNAESITATGGALGEFTGSAAAAMAKGMK